MSKEWINIILQSHLSFSYFQRLSAFPERHHREVDFDGKRLAAADFGPHWKQNVTALLAFSQHIKNDHAVHAENNN